MKQLERAPHSAAMLCLEGTVVAGPGGLSPACPHHPHPVQKERGVPFGPRPPLFGITQRPACRQKPVLSVSAGSVLCTGHPKGRGVGCYRRLGMHPALIRVEGLPSSETCPELWGLPPQQPTQCLPAPLTGQPRTTLQTGVAARAPS